MRSCVYRERYPFFSMYFDSALLNQNETITTKNGTNK